MKKTIVVGIAGGSASGKSTFSINLENELKHILPENSIYVMHMDNYFKAERDRPRSLSPLNGVCYVDDNHPQTMDLERFCDDLRDVSESRKYTVILAEGLMTLYDASIRELCDIKIFIDCRADERIVRRIKRNMQWGQTFEQITDVYLNLVRFRHDEYVEPSRWQADFIINGAKPFEKAIHMISAYLINMRSNTD